MSRHDAVISSLPECFSWKKIDELYFQALIYERSEKLYLLALLMTIGYKDQRYSLFVLREGILVNDNFSFYMLPENDNKDLLDAATKLAKSGFYECARYLNAKTKIDAKILKLFQDCRDKNLLIEKELASYKETTREEFLVESAFPKAIAFVGGASSVCSKKEIKAAEILLKGGSTAVGALGELIKKYTSEQPQSPREANEAMRALTVRIKKCVEFFNCLKKKPLNKELKKELFVLKRQFDSLNQQESDLRQRLLLLAAKECDSRQSAAASRQPKKAIVTACAATVTQQVVEKKGPLVAAALEKTVAKVIVESPIEDNVESKTMLSAMRCAASSERALQSAESKKRMQLQAKIHALEANVASLNAVVRREKAVIEIARKKQADAEAKMQVEIAAAAGRSAKELDELLTALCEEVEKLKEALLQAKTAEKATQEQCAALTITLQKLKLSAEGEAKRHAKKEKEAEIERQRLFAEMLRLQVVLQYASNNQKEKQATAERVQSEAKIEVEQIRMQLAEKSRELDQVKMLLDVAKSENAELRGAKQKLLCAGRQNVEQKQTVNERTDQSQVLPSSGGAGFLSGTVPATRNNTNLKKPSALAAAFLGL
jgi:hypothetical protein